MVPNVRLVGSALHCCDGVIVPCASKARREAVRAISQRLGVASSALLEVLDVREKQLQKKELNVRELAARYLAEVEKVASAVDLALDENPSQRT